MMLAMFAPPAPEAPQAGTPVRKAQGRPGDSHASTGRSPSGGHWVTMHGRHVYLDDQGCYHVAGKDSPAVDPTASDFIDRVADVTVHGVMAG